MKRVGSGEEAGTGRPASASRRANTAAPWAAAVVIVVALAAAWFALERGVFTQPWRQAAARELSQALGAPVSVEAVGAGVNRLVLHEVEVDGAWPAAAERVVVGLSWVDVLLRRAAPLEAVRWVEIHGLSVEVPWDGWPGRRSGRAGADEAGEAGAAPEEADPADAAPEWPALSALLQEVERLQGRLRERQQQRPVPAERELLVRWRDGRVRFRLGEGGPAMEAAAEGVVAWRGGRLLMERLTARAAELELTLNGTLFPRTDVYARLVADDLARAMDSLPRDGAGAPVHAAGRVELEAWLTGSSAAPRAWGTVHGRDLRAALDAAPEAAGGATGEATGVYAADELTGYWTYEGAGLVEARLEARRRAAQVWLEGVVNPADGSFRFAVDATDVDVPGDVPPLARYDVAGLADFSGMLTGTVAQPKLEGSVASDGGRLWGQPFSKLQGRIELTRERFAFERAVAAQGPSEYYLDGVVGFASPAAGEPGHVDLVVRTDRGRAETVLAVFGWDVPVEAALSGTAAFSGPPGAVAAEGDVSLTHGVAFGQPFDVLSGNFRYEDGMFSVAGVEGKLRGGAVGLEGGGRWSGPWRLTVRADDVPLQAVAAVRDRWPEVSGLAGFDGVVEVEEPGAPVAASGTVSGRHLQVGPAAFAEAEGRVALHGGRLTAEALRLHRPRGGTYTMAGTVEDVMGRALLDLSIGVADEAAGELTALLGWAPPVPVTGNVAASIRLEGPAGNPEARIRLDAPAVSVAGRTAALGLTLRLKDGRIDVEEWDRSLGAAAAEDAPGGPRQRPVATDGGADGAAHRRSAGALQGR